MTKHTRRILTLLLAVAITLSLTACGSPSAAEQTAAPTTAPTAAPATGGDNATGGETGEEKTNNIQEGTVFRYAINFDAPAYLPWIDNRANPITYQLYDNLLYKHQGDQNDIRGNLAESWTVSDDSLVWVFQIKQDAYFTSGNQVNAEAFIKSWDAAKQYMPNFFTLVESYAATGEFELTIKLNGPSATFIYDLPMRPNCGVVDPAALEEFGPEDNRAGVGSGPYYVEEYVSGDGFTLKANPNYHNAAKAPSIETVEMVMIPDENTSLIAFLNGEIDCMNTLNIEVYHNLVDRGENVMVVEDRANPIWFNAREVEIFRDKTVREALCHMIDRQALSDLVYDGVYPVPNSYWKGPGEVPYGPEHDYDPELGLRMLEDAGYSLEDMDFEILADPDTLNLVVAMVAQFNELGLSNVEVVSYDGATCYGMLKSGTYEMFPCHNGYSLETPLSCYSMGLLPDGAQRLMWLEYMNEEAYELALEKYEAAIKATDFAEHVKNIEALTEICQNECAAIGGLQIMRFFAFSPEIKGMCIAPVIGHFEFCYLRYEA